jgi:hypothetical protein
MRREKERPKIRRVIFREVLFVLSSGGDGEAVGGDQKKARREESFAGWGSKERPATVADTSAGDV